MRNLIHMAFDPACRFVRLALAEKGLATAFIEKAPWDDPAGDIAALNPAGTIPILVDEPPTGGSITIAPAIVIAEYLEEAYGASALYPQTSASRAECRRLLFWFFETFERDVGVPLIREQIDKRLMRAGAADFDQLRDGRKALDWHLDYFAWLLEQRTWFADEQMTIADFAAAAYISTLDYLDAILWSEQPILKEWYMRIKSRPSFRPLLADRLDGIPPPRQYAELDF